MNSIAVEGGFKAGLNLVAIVRDYVENMLNEVQGRKALILDKETLGKEDE